LGLFQTARGGEALAINDLGQVVGQMEYDLGHGGFLWEDGVLRGWGGSSVVDINNLGQSLTGDATGPAILDPDGTWHRLASMAPPRSGWDYSRLSPKALNDFGQTVGHGQRFNDGDFDYRAYLATPVYPSMTLTVTGDLLQSGRVNELVVEGATPGARV